MGLIKNYKVVDLGVELWMKKVEEASVLVFRQLVWVIFCEILEQTPQWSGKAVANWNIGVGQPDFSWDDTAGDNIDLWGTNVHQRGSNQWITAAMVRNWPRLKEIKRRERVYITNGVVGDSDNGKSSEFYMESLQEPAYWQDKLRSVNKPYEIAAETMARVMAETRIYGLPGGSGLALARVGGNSLEELA